MSGGGENHIPSIEAGIPGRYNAGSHLADADERDSRGLETTKAAFGGGLRIGDVFLAGASSENSDGFATPLFGECEPAPPDLSAPQQGLTHIRVILGRVLNNIQSRMGDDDA